MLAKACALALIGSAAAFNAPMMSLNVDRRAAVAAGAATVALPLAADAANYGNMQGTTSKTDMRSSLAVGKVSIIKPPVVEIFDSRGCDVKFSNYKGPAA